MRLEDIRHNLNILNRQRLGFYCLSSAGRLKKSIFPSLSSVLVQTILQTFKEAKEWEKKWAMWLPATVRVQARPVGELWKAVGHYYDLTKKLRFAKPKLVSLEFNGQSIQAPIGLLCGYCKRLRASFEFSGNRRIQLDFSYPDIQMETIKAALEVFRTSQFPEGINDGQLVNLWHLGDEWESKLLRKRAAYKLFSRLELASLTRVAPDLYMHVLAYLRPDGKDRASEVAKALNDRLTCDIEDVSSILGLFLHMQRLSIKYRHRLCKVLEMNAECAVQWLEDLPKRVQGKCTYVNFYGSKDFIKEHLIRITNCLPNVKVAQLQWTGLKGDFRKILCKWKKLEHVDLP